MRRPCDNAYEAFNTSEMKTLTGTFDESASWHTPGRSPIAGDASGREAVFAQFGRYVGDTGGTFKAILKEVLRSDSGRVVGIHHNTANNNIMMPNQSAPANSGIASLLQSAAPCGRRR